jgi:hypothetical protein
MREVWNELLDFITWELWDFLVDLFDFAWRFAAMCFFAYILISLILFGGQSLEP